MAKQHDKQFKLDAVQYYEDQLFGVRPVRPSKGHFTERPHWGSDPMKYK